MKNELGVINIFKYLIKKYKASRFSDEHGGPPIYILAIFFISTLLAVYAAFSYVGKIQAMATNLSYGIEVAAKTAFGNHAIPDTTNNGVQVSNAGAFQNEFISILQDQMKDWPRNTYTIRSLETFGESDRGSLPPTEFSNPVPGTSVYIKMDMHIKIDMGFIPVFTRWTIPIYVMVSSNSYDASTGAWNLAR
ncbi:hypothetical protein [Desulfitobacterium dehalogenans]|uniref:hypothetical protein n=1 Tax=Desulfitobacterium dehalogenans TaxID=36854 RepID=UPI001FA6C3B8|nr:hypothetical protein [Desulfitobacterium dehalogenans]